VSISQLPSGKPLFNEGGEQLRRHTDLVFRQLQFWEHDPHYFLW
jgi:hypothetical protein